MRLLMLVLFSFVLSANAWAYSYSAAGKEPLIDGRTAIVRALNDNDDAKLTKYYATLREDVEFLAHKYDQSLLSDFDKAVAQKDKNAILVSMHRLYFAEIQRRLEIASRNLDTYQSAKVMVVKSMRFFDVIAPELPKDQTNAIQAALQGCLDAIGKPGVFGAGQTPADPAAYQRALDDLVKAVAR